ncbi:MAG: permease prefix domain 1-containing protein, partial [Clostridiaceae bacterium]
MQESNVFKEYIDLVTNQIRWNRARNSVQEEINNHLLDQKEAYLAQGMSEELAEKEAVRQMGDPVSVGMELDSIHRPKTSKTMIVLTAILIITGLLVRVFLTYDANSSYKVLHSIISVSLGIGILIGAFYLDFSFVGRHPLLIYSMPILLAFISFFTIYKVVYGVSVGTHYLILIFPLGYGAFIYSIRGKGYRGLLLCGAAYILQCSIAIYAGSNSGLITITLSSSVLLFVAAY